MLGGFVFAALPYAAGHHLKKGKPATFPTSKPQVFFVGQRDVQPVTPSQRPTTSTDYGNKQNEPTSH
jgi:hypothetical protein